MKSRLTELAMQIVNRNTVRVLDYAPPEHRPTPRERWDSFIDWCRGYPCLCIFTFGLMLCIASMVIDDRRGHSAVSLAGVTIMSGAIQWWLRRSPRW